jgi:Family of unknown function (DUF6527)
MGLPAPLTDPWFEAHFVIERFGRHHPTFQGAHGIWLYCPCGYGKPDKHAHGLLVPFKGAPEHNFGVVSRDRQTKPKWAATGSGMHDLTLMPSVDVGEPSCWHGFITKGIVT